MFPRMARYVALLRGINVGGKNPIRMADLKACLEADGLRSVVTYIQSGNVLFDADGAKAADLTVQLEAVLEPLRIIVERHHQPAPADLDLGGS